MHTLRMVLDWVSLVTVHTRMIVHANLLFTVHYLLNILSLRALYTYTVTFDDQQAVCDKADYVNMNLLGGLFVWEMSGDLMENLVRPLSSF